MVAFKTPRRAAAIQALRRPAATDSLRRRLGPVLLALVLGVGGSGLLSGAAQAREWSGAEPDAPAEASGAPTAREGLRLQRAQAWIRLNGPQRSRLFASLRTLEAREARARLDLLSDAERCLERAQGVDAVEACQDREHGRRRALRQAHHAELAALMKSYGLPQPPARPPGMGWRHGRSGAGHDGWQGGRQAPLPW